jgi:hypothetical protein
VFRKANAPYWVYRVSRGHSKQRLHCVESRVCESRLCHRSIRFGAIAPSKQKYSKQKYTKAAGTTGLSSIVYVIAIAQTPEKAIALLSVLDFTINIGGVLLFFVNSEIV